MAYYLLIRGPLGIGKSTIAKMLSKELDGVHISIDHILEQNGLDQIKDEKCIPIENFIKANEIILPIIQSHLDQGQIVILDGNFYQQEQIQHLIQNLCYPHFDFTLKAPIDVCIERDKTRERPYGQDAATAVFNLVSQFDHGIIIQTYQKSADEVMHEILSHLPI